MKHPAWIALVAALVIVLGALAPALWRVAFGPASNAPPPSAAGDDGLPWQVAVAADGTATVFALRLPGTTLGQARERFGDDLRVAVMARRGEPGALEAYLENFRAGAIAGRLVLVADPGPQAVARWRQGAAREEIVDADARRTTLRADDLAEALRAPLVGISFIPAANLDADALRARFGEPAERLASGERIVQWLYPAKGLAIALDPGGRDVLQYVAPADFERRLRAPLISAGATPAP